MANVFSTAIMSCPASVNNRVRPQFADPIFWSEPLMTVADTPTPPLVQYVFVTSTGDEFVDNFDNQLVAAF